MSRTMAALALAGGIVASLSLPAGSARAQPTEASVRAQAQRHFDEGVRLLRDRDWAGALRAFEASRELRETASVVFNIAGCLRTLRRNADARRAYQRVLEIGGRPDQRDESTRAIAELAGSVASLRVRVNVEGAEVTLDGRPLDAQPVDVDLESEHVVEVRHEGHEPARQTVRPEQAGPLTLTLTLAPRPAPAPPPVRTTVTNEDVPPPAAPATAPPPPDRYGQRSSGSVWPWIVGGAVLVLAGGAVAGYFVVSGGDEPTGDLTLHPR